MIVLLVGPSGVGKTETYQAIEDRFPAWVFRHLDGLATRYARGMGWIAAEASVHELDRYAKNPEHFLAIGLQAITELAAQNPGRHLVIDVGAGFQKASYATRLPSQYLTIAIIADLPAVHARWGSRAGNSADLSWYMEREFSPARRSLYDRAHERIDTTRLSIGQAGDRLAEALQKLLRKPSPF